VDEEHKKLYEEMEDMKSASKIANDLLLKERHILNRIMAEERNNQNIDMLARAMAVSKKLNEATKDQANIDKQRIELEIRLKNSMDSANEHLLARGVGKLISTVTYLVFASWRGVKRHNIKIESPPGGTMLRWSRNFVVDRRLARRIL